MILRAPSPPDAILSDLRRTIDSRRTRTLAWRLEQLRGIERLLTEQKSAIAAALADDLGRSAVEAYMGDITTTRAEVAHARKHMKRWMRPRRRLLPQTSATNQSRPTVTCVSRSSTRLSIHGSG